MSVININKHSFKKEVLESEKPVLLDIWAPWSGRNSKNLAEEIASVAQFQIYYCGAGVKGTSFYGEKAVMPMDAVFDIAGWAVFPNLVSAQVYDLVSAAN